VSKLTLISAQAGFGKTTLLSEWIRQCELPACWLSLEEGDNDPRRFLKYMVAALQTVKETGGEKAEPGIQPGKGGDVAPAGNESVLTQVINEITFMGKPFVFVLDDYHMITEREIQEMMLFLLEHMPAHMHLVISSRADPPWPISRLKAYGEIVEIRSEEMRFSADEAREFLNTRMGLGLSYEDVIALERRTEGWIVGLQLAALSMQGHPHREMFIQAFTGSHRYVVDYLVEEVLSQQPPEMREFLLKTSILSRMTAELCDAVVGRENSQAVLEVLERRNLFVVGLDDERRWYRYHHLFADLLRFRLQQENVKVIQDMHKRASTWYAENGLLADAVHHALAANDLDQILQLSEDLTVYRLDEVELKDLLGWLDRMPKTELELYPQLLVTQAWANFNLGKYELAEKILDRVDWMTNGEEQKSERAKLIQGHAAAIRCYLAELREDPRLAMQQAEEALMLLPEEEVQLRAFVAIRKANCLVWFGYLEKAISVYREAGEACQRVGEGQLAINALSEMAATQMLYGRLRQAVENIMKTCQYAENLAVRDGRKLPTMGILYRHMATIQRERNELAEAEHYAEEAIRVCEQWGEKESTLVAKMTFARVLFAQGKIEHVEENFEDIQRIAGEISPVYVDQFRSWIVLYRLLMGKLEQAKEWIGETGLSFSGCVEYEQHQNYYIYARYLLATGKYLQALEMVVAILSGVRSTEAGMYVIRYRTLQAILMNHLGRVDEAMSVMADALGAAREEGYVRSILDEGEQVNELLRMAISRGIEVVYAGELLGQLESETRLSSQPLPGATYLVEPLSEREMEVLRLLLTDLKVPEIAKELVIGASTVRSHIKSIYAKLNAHSRYEAVEKAKELRLV